MRERYLNEDFESEYEPEDKGYDQEQFIEFYAANIVRRDIPDETLSKQVKSLEKLKIS